MLKLYSEEIKDIKLVKYHTSKSCVIFFFLHRNEYNFSNDESDTLSHGKFSGVYFFTIKLISQLKLMTIHHKSLIKKGSVIFIPNDLKNITSERYDEKTILQYENRNKIINWTSNEINFESVRDLGDPVSDFFPFIFHNWITK